MFYEGQGVGGAGSVFWGPGSVFAVGGADPDLRERWRPLITKESTCYPSRAQWGSGRGGSLEDVRGHMV